MLGDTPLLCYVNAGWIFLVGHKRSTVSLVSVKQHPIDKSCAMNDFQIKLSWVVDAAAHAIQFDAHVYTYNTQGCAVAGFLLKPVATLWRATCCYMVGPAS